ncbi:MAG TPA: amino acid--tRNA ligase-related protein [Candidatus Babeliales bacterium]|jgi:aspartyl/asparaginyl-tRNA synthetase|nr:amino acid--tRNA ligase-related protein [Candidatus Babeliales bacterium]
MQDAVMYDYILRKMRTFFLEQKNFIEVPAQSRLSILAACEDPKTITQFVFSGVNYPLPQTGQMWLEVELLKNPRLKGVFCSTTSYRNEPFPIHGRHDKIFPMVEFEAPGTIDTMRKLEAELLDFLGFAPPISLQYNDVCKRYNTQDINAECETQMAQDIGPVISLEKFPLRTHPFWNMKRDSAEIFNKIDVILYGMETIGSAERSTDVQEMRDYFFNISNGQYAQLLFSSFGKERVIKELDEYLSLPMFPRFGGGIGVTRMARALTCAGIDRKMWDHDFIGSRSFGQINARQL